MRTLSRFGTLDSFAASALVVFHLTVLLGGCGGRGAAQSEGGQKPPTYPDAQTAATRAIDPLRKLVTADNARDMGFENPAEAAAAALGQPIRVQMVRLDALKNYVAGADPGGLLMAADRILYPVTVKDQVKSSIIVEGSGNQWKATSFGGPHLAGQIARVRADVTGRLKPAADSVSVVHVAALNLYFLSYRIEGRLMLTPLENHPHYQLEAGSSLPADQVFASLAPIARNYNGLPL
jgi:hypothetical protein